MKYTVGKKTGNEYALKKKRNKYAMKFVQKKKKTTEENTPKYTEKNMK